MNRYVVVQYSKRSAVTTGWLMSDIIFDTIEEANEYAQRYCNIHDVPRELVPWEVVELKELGT